MEDLLAPFARRDLPGGQIIANAAIVGEIRTHYPDIAAALRVDAAAPGNVEVKRARLRLADIAIRRLEELPGLETPLANLRDRIDGIRQQLTR